MASYCYLTKFEARTEPKSTRDNLEGPIIFGLTYCDFFTHLCSLKKNSGYILVFECSIIGILNPPYLHFWVGCIEMSR